MLLFMSFMYSRKRTGLRTEPCGTPDVTHVLSDRAPLTETLCFRCERNDFYLKTFCHRIGCEMAARRSHCLWLSVTLS